LIIAHLLPTRLVILRFPDSGWWSFPRSAKKLLRGSGVLGHATGAGVAGVAGGVLDYTDLQGLEVSYLVICSDLRWSSAVICGIQADRFTGFI